VREGREQVRGSERPGYIEDEKFTGRTRAGGCPNCLDSRAVHLGNMWPSGTTQNRWPSDTNTQSQTSTREINDFEGG